MEHRILLIRDTDDRAQAMLLQQLGNLRFRSGGYLRCQLIDAQGHYTTMAHLTPQCAVELRLPLAVGEEAAFCCADGSINEAVIAAQLQELLRETEGKSLILLPHLEDYLSVPDALCALLEQLRQRGTPILISIDPNAVEAARAILSDEPLDLDAADDAFPDLLQLWLESCRAKARSDRYDNAYKQHYDNEPSRPQNQKPEKKKRSLLDWKPRELYED